MADEAPSEKPEVPPKRGRGYGKPFQKNDPRIRKPVELSEGPPDQLADMRHVYSRPGSEDRTPGQRACRAWLAKEPHRFLSKMYELEGSARPAAEGLVLPERVRRVAERLLADPNLLARVESVLAEPEGDESRVIALCEQWLKERADAVAG